MKEEVGNRRREQAKVAMVKLEGSFSKRYFVVAGAAIFVIAYIPNCGTYAPFGLPDD